MKLIPKAKPVRIRITVGNEEHNSLESLQENFVWDDIISLLDGRLIKWLRRINANSIADNLLELSSPTEKPLEVYNILFRGNSPFVEADEVFIEAQHNHLLLPLAEVISQRLSAQELLSYGQSYTGIADVFAKSLAALSEKFTGEESGRELFEIGEFLYSLDRYKELGKNCIILASKRGLREANEFKRTHLTVRRNDENIELILAQRDTIDKISYSWTTSTPISLFGTRGAQTIIFDFSNSCMLIYEKSKKISNSDCLKDLVNSYFELISADDALFQEKTFVHALFEPDMCIAKQRLQKISYYHPAKTILKSGKFALEGHVFQLCKGFSNATHLRFYITNLLNFRSHDELGK